MRSRRGRGPLSKHKLYAHVSASQRREVGSPRRFRCEPQAQPKGRLRQSEGIPNLARDQLLVHWLGVSRREMPSEVAWILGTWGTLLRTQTFLRGFCERWEPNPSHSE